MNGLIKWDPFRDLSDMHRQLDDMFGGLVKGGMAQSLQMPAMDVYTEGDKQLIAEVHAPGFDREDVEVSVHEGILEIKGKKHEKVEDKDNKRNYMARESSTSFYRRIVLPKYANGDKVDAKFENGMLKVVVPFKELPKPKKVSIK